MRSTFEYSCNFFSDVTLYCMAGFLTSMAEKHSCRYLHAGMQASEENNISFKACDFE